MGIGDVLCGTSSSCTVRNPCPSENRAGYGLFFTLRENKTLYKHSRWRSSTSGKLSASITGSSKERKEKRYAERTFSVDNRKERTVAFSRKLYPVRHSGTNPYPCNIGSGDCSTESRHCCNYLSLREQAIPLLLLKCRIVLVSLIAA